MTGEDRDQVAERHSKLGKDLGLYLRKWKTIEFSAGELHEQIEKITLVKLCGQAGRKQEWTQEDHLGRVHNGSGET